MPPEMREVNSSNIHSVGYQNGDLYVTFHGRCERKSGGSCTCHGGDSYRYSGVPPAVYQEFLESESQGSYFSKHIRGHGYQTEKLTPVEHTKPPEGLS